MADVVLNSAVRSNLRTLQSTTELLNRTEERLATGKKVNSALDNPASFFTANALDRRASDLSSLLDSVASSIKTLEAADNGIKAITEIVEGLKATARSALQSPLAVEEKAKIESSDLGAGATAKNLLGGATTTPASAGSVSFAFGAATTLADAADTLAFSISVDGATPATAITINQAAVQAAGNGDTTIDDADELREILTNLLGANVTVGGADDAITIASNTTGAASAVTITGYTETDADNDVTDGTGLGDATNAGLDAVTSGPLYNQTLTVKDKNGVDVVVNFGPDPGEIDSLEELNKFFDDNDILLDASFDLAERKLTITTDNTVANSKPAAVTGSAIGVGGAFASGAYSDVKLDQANALKRSNFADDYNESMKEIGKLAKDANYNGVNLLMGDDLDVIFNEDGSSKLQVNGVIFDEDGVGLSRISAEDFYDSGSIQSVLDRIEAAFKTIEAQSAKFGSQLQVVQTREVFTKDMIGTLEDGAHSLTAADTNEEAANLATLQTRQQLIVTSLSISTQQESAVLQLLR